MGRWPAGQPPDPGLASPPCRRLVSLQPSTKRPLVSLHGLFENYRLTLVHGGDAQLGEEVLLRELRDGRARFLGAEYPLQVSSESEVVVEEPLSSQESQLPRGSEAVSTWGMIDELERVEDGPRSYPVLVDCIPRVLPNEPIQVRVAFEAVDERVNLRVDKVLVTAVGVGRTGSRLTGIQLGSLCQHVKAASVEEAQELHG